MSRTEALRLLADAEISGDLGDRDAGIALGFEALAATGPDVQLSLRLGRALRARYRTTYEWQALDSAVTVLQAAVPAARGAEAAAVGAELAFALVQVSDQLQVRDLVAEGDGAPLTPQEVIGEAEGAAHAACAAASDAPEQALALHALGTVRLAQDRPEEAVAILDRALACAPRDAGVRRDLAIALASRASPDTVRAAALFDEVARRLSDAPREAFEAARFHGFWAAQREAWREAGDAFVQALLARGALRREQGEHARRREWLQEAGPIPSQAACALVRAGCAEAAASAFDSGLALNLADRLGLGVPGDHPLTPVPRPPPGETLVMLAFDDRGGAAIAIPAAGAATTALLPSDTARGALVERQLPAVGAYVEWLQRRSPAALRVWTHALEDLLAWVGETILSPALALLPDPGGAVALVTDGRLGLLPLHAATVDGIPVLERRCIRTAPSARLLALARARPAAPGAQEVLAVGVSTAGDTPRLEHADAEARSVAALSAGTRLIDASATRPAVETELARHAVAHFACHADARPDDALQSAIFLSDAPLTLGRLLELRLNDMQLVVLSACETGVPDVGIPEEMLSLAGGLLHAGAGGVAATQWAIGDLASLLASLRFHVERRDGGDACGALRSTQLWLRDVTAAEARAWLSAAGERLAVDLVAELAALAALDPRSRPFRLLPRWAGFVYYGA